jgi:hypothetical protein
MPAFFVLVCLIDAVIYSFTLLRRQCRVWGIETAHTPEYVFSLCYTNSFSAIYLFHSWQQVAICVQFVSHTTERVYLIRLGASV